MLDPAAASRRDDPSRRRPLLRTIIGDVLRRTRLNQGRTLAEVARLARVSLPYLSELERGRKEASSEVLAAICEALHIELPDLLAAVGRDLRQGRDRRAAFMRISGFAADDGQAPLAERDRPADDLAEPAPAPDSDPAPSADAQHAMLTGLSDAPHFLLSEPVSAPYNTAPLRPGELRCLLRAA
jgi:transcriptional regulator with XRE-family HTH domain